jgi:hypothetical protein
MSEKRTLAQKLLEVQRNIGAVTKSATNPHFKSRYADLNEVLDVAKEALNAEGIFVAQGGDHDAGGPFIRTSLIDADSGHTMDGKVYLVGTPDMQKMGAAITYARRFGLVSLLALESEDDDGEEAVGRGVRQPAQSPARSSKPSDGGPSRPENTGTIAAKAPAPVQAAVPSGFKEKTKEELMAAIGSASKAYIDLHTNTKGVRGIGLDEQVLMLKSFGVVDKTELTQAQARQLLDNMQERGKK